MQELTGTRCGEQAGGTTNRRLLELVLIPPRLSLIVRSDRTVAYNPNLNIWHAVDDFQAEILRWLRAKRNRDELVMHIARRFSCTQEDAENRVQRSLQQLTVRRLLDLRPPEAGVPALPEYPIASVYWIATQACNLRCTYCYQEAAERRENELSTEEVFELVRQVKALGANVFVITGGEPFVRRDLLPIVRYARSLDLKVNVITNGHYVNRSNAAEIARLFDRITISIDHSKPEHHDRHRGKGSWRKSRTAIDLLLAAEGRVDINSTLSRAASADLEGLLSLRSDKRIGVHRVVPQYPMGRGRDGGNDPLTPDELLSIDHRIYETSRRLAGDEKPTQTSVRNLAAGKGVLRAHCGAGLSEVSVDPEGWVYPCRLLQFDKYRGDNIRNVALRDIILKNMNIGRVRYTTAGMLPKCGTCVVQKYCGGGCRGIHASFTDDAHKSDALFCSHLRQSFELKVWESTGHVPAQRRVSFLGRAMQDSGVLVNIRLATNAERPQLPGG